MTICIHCKLEKEESEFYSNPLSAKKISSQCKECCSSRKREDARKRKEEQLLHPPESPIIQDTPESIAKKAKGSKWKPGEISKNLLRCENCSKMSYKWQRENPCTHYDLHNEPNSLRKV